ncbi:hypothetical protein C8Q73DRAFT_206215 [Cubamyces lactineus]|nr:hypothetical protein C8Q73DRAFT_206215 [Cubamyces lactineus]
MRPPLYLHPRPLDPSMSLSLSLSTAHCVCVCVSRNVFCTHVVFLPLLCFFPCRRTYPYRAVFSGMSLPCNCNSNIIGRGTHLRSRGFEVRE